MTVQFEPVAKLQKEMCESNGRKEQIQQALCSALDASIELEFSVSGADATSAADEHQAVKGRRQDLLNDPAVRTVLMGLNATVTNIEEQ